MRTALSNVWQDLKRRRVFQVAAIYAAGAWVIVQVADVVGPAINMPNWIMTAIVGFAMVGFPIAVILAWLFDVGPGGVIRTKPGSATGILLIVVSFGLLGAGTTGFVWLIKPGQRPHNVEFNFEPVVNSIAVMPFLDMSAGGQYGHFADGISEVLIHQLSQVAELHVIARRSSFAFKGQQRDMRDIGRTLRVGRLLEGSVQRAEGKLRITAQLIDARTGAHVWTKLFDRDEEDLFEIQDEISIAVVNAMEIELSDEAKGRLSAGLTDDLDALELYLLGRNNFMMADAYGGAAESIALFKRALARDPNFALAWSGLADSYLLHAIGGKMTMGEALDESQAAVRRALQLDPKLGEAYASQIFIAAMKGDLDSGRKAFNHSSTLSPSYPMQYLWYGNLLMGNDLLSESMEIYAIGMQLQPYKPYHLLKYGLVVSLIQLGQYDDGMRLLVELRNEHRGTHLEEQYASAPAEFAVYGGRFVHAIAYAELAALRGFDTVDLRYFRAWSYLELGDYKEAERQLSLAEGMLSHQVEEVNAWGRDWLQYSRALYHFEIGMEADSLENVDELLKAIDEIDPEAAWFLGTKAADASRLCMLHRRFDDVVRLENLVIRSFITLQSLVNAAFASQQIGNIKLANEYIERGRETLDKWVSHENRSDIDHVVLAQFQVVTGDTESALKSLQAAAENGQQNYATLRSSPIFDVLRSDSRFTTVLQNMKVSRDADLERVHLVRSTGDWNRLVAEHFTIATTAIDR